MKIDPFLGKAARLAKRRDFENALRIIKSEEDRYSGSLKYNFKYYYIYAVICLHSGDFGGAYSNFRRAWEIKHNDPLTNLGLAVLHLKRMDTVKAVDFYLETLESEPNNKTAKKALTVIRKYSDADFLFEWLTQERLAKLYPPIPGASISPKMLLTASLVAAAAAILVFGLLVKFRVLQSPFKSRSSRPTAEFVLSGQERREPVEVGGSYSYILTRDQATGLYDRALALFTEYRDEAAKISLNRILESNASDGLKNKSRLLMSYTEIPGFDSFRRGDNVTFSQVRAEPVIYRDVHVIWAGMATNVEVTDEFTRFDFLVGYDTRRTLEGIVPVVFTAPVAINPERPLEVLGRIAVAGAEIRLDGVAIHQSGRLEN